MSKFLEPLRFFVGMLHDIHTNSFIIRAEVMKMSARSDAMNAALDRLTNAVNTEAENVRTAVAAAIAARQSDDNAAFDAATQRVVSAADALTNHTTVATNAVASAPPDTASNEPQPSGQS